MVNYLYIHEAGLITSGNLQYVGSYGFYWSSTGNSPTNAMALMKNYSVSFSDYSKTNGFTLRCLRAQPASVTTAAVTDLTGTTATCGGNVVSEGISTVTEKGVCWSTSPNLTISNSHTNDGAGAGSFSSSLWSGAATSNVVKITVRPAFTPGSISGAGEIICYAGNPGLIGSNTPASGGAGRVAYRW